MFVAPENYSSVTRVLIKGWWYDVLSQSFTAVGDNEYQFEYTKGNRVFNGDVRTMHARGEVIDSVSYSGEL